MERFKCSICVHYEDKVEKTKKKFEGKTINAIDPNWIELTALWEAWETHGATCKAYTQKYKVLA